MKKLVISLGTVCKDKGTGLEGTLTHWYCDMGGRVDYLFQPTGINTDDGQPIDKIGLEMERLIFDENSQEEVEIPTEILGTKVWDKASGFSGIAVSFIRHPNGCFHVVIQPQGRLAKTNSPVRKRDFDLRQCAGPAIKELSSQELRKSEEDRPSPTGDFFPERFPVCLSSTIHD